ncbi:MAG: Ig-like domain-containing protein, partial [Anaerolineae bacterium]|nr:Ig-like domain-containing protein [Anaerolineae bacterium]
LLTKGFILSEATGPWRSIYSYTGTGAKPQLGGAYLLRGTLTEYYGTTEFSYPGRAYQGAGDDVCAPTVVTALDVPANTASKSEAYESTIVEYHTITITAVETYGALFKDSSGGTGSIGQLSYYPADIAVGQRYVYVRGPLIYDRNRYRVMPPTSADIKLLDLTPPTVSATLPANGATGVSPYQPLYATFSEPVNPTTVNASTFSLTGSDGAVAGTVTYDAATKQATFTPATALAPNSAYTAALTAGVKDLSDNALIPHSWTFTTGAEDTTPPAVTARTPVAGAVDVALNANIVVTFSESLKPATVVGGNFTLTGPYGAVPWDSVAYDLATSRLTLNPGGLLLPETVYTFTIATAVTDWAGLPVVAADRVWSFTTRPEPPMFAYQGDIHNHTGYSDGSLTPFEAFTRAKAAGLDFLAISDHSYAIDDTEWADTLAQVEAFTENGVFVALRGFEYTQGAEGHLNVYNTVRHAVRSDVDFTYADYTPNLERGQTVDGFYHWLAITGTQALDGYGTVMQFNHPGWINFNDWKYHPEVESIAQLEEIGNGWGSSYFFSWDEWVRSLDYGWKVGATNNSDNHTSSWGTITPHRTGVVMPALTKGDLLDALRAGRTYASEDSNTELFFKANGYWMGSELPNTGNLTFEIWGEDPDDELTTKLELYSDGGVVVTSTQPTGAAFDWSFALDVTPGVHYYFVMATQADGDRIVSSPVWTMGEEDVSITDLTVQPTIPTIYNPNLFTARVTNRGATTQTLTVTFSINDSLIGSVPVTVPPCSTGPCADVYANITWQATEVGPVEVVAELQGAPASDAPEDNRATLQLNATDERVPLIIIDNGHNNIASDLNSVRPFVNDMTAHGYNVLFNLDEITATDLNTATTRLLIINAFGPAPLTEAELAAIADYVAAGGSLWLNGLSDYTGKVEWADTVADRMNAIVAAVEARTGQQIPIRVNDDEVLDGNNNNGYQWGVVWHLFPSAFTTGIGMNVEGIQTWSVSSLVDRNHRGLSQADLGENGFIAVLGDLDAGSSSGAHYSNVPNRTHNTDADSWGDAYLYPAGEALPSAAGYDIPGAPGRFFFYGDSNDPFNIFSYTAGDGRQNEIFNLETVMWLLGEPLQKQTIAEVREGGDDPVNLRKLVWVEGVVTAAYGEFFDVLYVQDETGGITVFAPAGTASGAVGAMPERGDFIRVLGTVDSYQGDTELQFFEAEQIQVITPTYVNPNELALGGNFLRPLSTAEAASEENEGWLMVVTGTVTAKAADNSYLLVDDGSGPVRAFLDGYNGTWETIHVLDRVTVAGLGSEDYDGQRIRVRHFQHDTRPNDAAVLTPVVDLRQSFKEVSAVEIYPGERLTYTLNFVNTGNLTATVEYADVLPTVLTLVSGDLEGTVEVGPLETVQVLLVTQVNPTTPAGTKFANTMSVDDGTTISDFTSPETTVVAPPQVVIVKAVEPTANVAPGD